MAEAFSVTPANRVRRTPKRASYDKKTVFEILDAGLIAHIGIVENARPFVIPLFYARVGDELLLHCASKSRMQASLTGGQQVCVTVTLIDGLVLARSAFHHSMNYRSVVAFGTGRLIEREDEREAASRAITEKVMVGRWDDSRHPTDLEYRATSLIALKIESASAKIRTGGPVDDEEDMSLPHWAGVIPLRQIAEEPEVDPDLDPSVARPNYLQEYLARVGRD